MASLYQLPEQLLARIATDPDQRLVFAHRGPVDHAVAGRLLALVEKASVEANDAVGLRKRLFSVVMEGLENMHRYAQQGSPERCFAILAEGATGYRLWLGNAASAEAADALANKVAQINAMDEVALKAHYLAVLGNGLRTSQGGAGLGLLTMARKSGAPLSLVRGPLEQGGHQVMLEAFLPR